MRRLTCTDAFGNVTILGEPGSGKIKYSISSLVGFDSGNPALRYTQKSPYQDGNTHIDTLLDERLITVTGVLYPRNDLTAQFTARRALAKAFNPKNGPITVLYEYSGGSKTVVCTLDQGPIFPNKSSTEPFQKYQINFVANDPWLYGSTTTIAATPLNVDIGGVMPPDGQDIAYGNGIFCVVGITVQNIGYYSTDNGKSWNNFTLPSVHQWTNIAYGNGTFIVISNIDMVSAHSADGINWHAGGNIPGTSPGNTSGFCFGNNIFMITGILTTGKGSAISIDNGLTWTATGSMPGTGPNWLKVCYGATHFVSIDVNHSKAAYSNDNGTTWTLATDPVTPEAWQGIAYNPISKAFAIGTPSNPGMVAYSTDDGLTWHNNISGLNNSGYFIVYGAGMFMCTYGTLGTIYTSYDGNIWANSTSTPGGVTWSCAAYGNGTFIFIGISANCRTINATSVTILGDYQTPALVTINGPATNPKIFNGDLYMRFIKVLAANESIIINTDPKAISIIDVSPVGVKTNAMKYLDLASTLWQLYPGINNIIFSEESGVFSIQVGMSYAERYSGV